MKRFSQLTQTANEADLVAGNFLAIDVPGAGGATKKLPGNLVTPQGVIAPEFNKNKAGGYYKYDVVMYNGLFYEFKNNHAQGTDWDANDVTQIDVTDFVFLKDFSANRGTTISVVGRGNTQVVRRFVCPANATLVVTPSPNTWSVTEVTSDSSYVFLVRWHDEADNVTNGIGWTKEHVSEIPSKIRYAIPQEAKFLDLWIRADAGVSLSFEISYSEAPQRIPSDAFEYGNINMTGTTLQYGKAKYTSRARFRKGVLATLKAGDNIILDAKGRMYISYSSDGNPPYSVEGWIKKFVAPYDCKASILLSNDPESSAPLSEIVGHLKLSSEQSDLLPTANVVSGLPFKEDALKDAQRVVLNGNDQTEVVFPIYPKAGTTLCFVLDKINWDVSNVSTASVKIAVRNTRDSDGEIDTLISWTQTRIPDQKFYVDIPTDSRSADIFFRGNVGQTLGITFYTIPKEYVSMDYRNEIVKSVNHRGWWLAPENTLPAYRESAKHGFPIVETDIRKTSDGYYVCIHDASVDRTSDGSGNVADMTLAQLKALDFGSWKNAKYAGTTIPTLEEFLICARNLGMEVYLELKDLSSSDVPNLLDIVRKYGMIDKSTWIGFDWDLMQAVLTASPNSRVGFLCGNVTNELVTLVASLKTATNDIFIDADYSLTDAEIALAKSAGVPLEVWLVDDRYVNTANEYISGFTSDVYVASRVLYQQEINKIIP